MSCASYRRTTHASSPWKRRRKRAAVSPMANEIKLSTYKINLAFAGICPGNPLLSTVSICIPSSYQIIEVPESGVVIGCRHPRRTRFAVAAASTSRSAESSEKNGSKDPRNVVSRAGPWLRVAFVSAVACTSAASCLAGSRPSHGLYEM